MSNLYLKEEPNGTWCGIFGTLVYVLICLLLALFLTFNVTAPAEEGGGILVNFGDTEAAAPGEDLPFTEELAKAEKQQEVARPSDAKEELLTQEHEEAPVVKKEVRKAKPKPQKTPVETPRQVNRKALFPGRTLGSQSAAEGTASGTGNQGRTDGDVNGSHAGSGLGTGSGNSFSLAGRSLATALPRPAYNVKKEGRVVIEIRVNQEGKVTWAEFRSKGSTTSDHVLVAAAESAARRASFNVDENAPFTQIGTITYIFRME